MVKCVLQAQTVQGWYTMLWRHTKDHVSPYLLHTKES